MDSASFVACAPDRFARFHGRTDLEIPVPARWTSAACVPLPAGIAGSAPLPRLRPETSREIWRSCRPTCPATRSWGSCASRWPAVWEW